MDLAPSLHGVLLHVRPHVRVIVRHEVKCSTPYSGCRGDRTPKNSGKSRVVFQLAYTPVVHLLFKVEMPDIVEQMGIEPTARSLQRNVASLGTCCPICNYSLRRVARRSGAYRSRTDHLFGASEAL